LQRARSVDRMHFVFAQEQSEVAISGLLSLADLMVVRWFLFSSLCNFVLLFVLWNREWNRALCFLFEHVQRFNRRRLKKMDEQKIRKKNTN
jgi:hypothetical protein